MFLTRKARETDDNLTFVRNRLLNNEKDVAALLELYRQVGRGKRVADDETNPLVSVLKLSGIVRVVDGWLKVRNRIYERVFDREWITKNMPDAELRRQRAAYRRGVLRATAVATAIVAVFAALTAFALNQKSRAEENAEKAREAATQARIAEGKERKAAEGLRVALGEKDKALTEREKALKEKEAQRALAVKVQNQAAQKAQEATRAARARAAEANTSRLLYLANMNLIQWEWESNNVGRVRELLMETAQSKERGFEWFYWQRMCHLDLMTLKGHTGVILSVAFSPDGRRIVTGSDDNTAKVWEAAPEQQVAIWEAEERAEREQREREEKIRRYAQDARDYLRAKQYEKAANSVQKLLELEPQRAAELCNNIAWSWANAPANVRNPQKALPLAQKAVQLEPNNSNYLNTLGVVYDRLGRYAQAVATLQKAVAAHKAGGTAFNFFFLAMSS